MKEGQVKILFALLCGIIIAFPFMYKVVIKPKNALEMYQAVRSTVDYDQLEKLILEGYEKNVPVELYDEIINSSSDPNKIRQFTVVQYADETYLLETSPGTMKLNILGLDKAPDEIRDYLSTLNSDD